MHCLSMLVNRRCSRIVRGQSVVKTELVPICYGRGQRSIYTCSRHLSAILPSAMCNHHLGLLFHMHICRPLTAARWLTAVRCETGRETGRETDRLNGRFGRRFAKE